MPSGSIQPPYPLIITQHGSTPDKRFSGGEGNTDEYSHRLKEMATKRGYAVAAIDAFNGCEDNPIILRFNGKHTFLDGSPADKAEVRWRKCFTQRAGSGKTYEDLDAVVSSVIDFFDKS